MPIVGIGKHLCGGATDLMLRCLTQQANAENKTSSCIFLHVIFGQIISDKTYSSLPPTLTNNMKLNISSLLMSWNKYGKTGNVELFSPFECSFHTGIFSSCIFLFVLDSAVGELEAIVLALCCHHRCDWQTYTGKEFFTDLGLTARDFHLICSMTSWATCATRTFLNKLAERATEDHENDEALKSKENSSITEIKAEIEENEPESKRTKIEDAKETTSFDIKLKGSKTGSVESGSDQQQKHSEPAGEHDSPVDDSEYYHPRYGSLTPEQREEAGYQCKKLIDMGRLKFIERHGFHVRLVKYTTSELSLENVALLATRKVR